MNKKVIAYVSSILLIVTGVIVISCYKFGLTDSFFNLLVTKFLSIAFSIILIICGIISIYLIKKEK